ncbi:DUF4185 domain-containing protein [Nocardia sp. NBC_01499]|uniref:DUF4185 domain-containing protein n=1 Tax=Nocardia sp. NBC_01499 TaxID=2903597 RepID=UPI00386DB719
MATYVKTLTGDSTARFGFRGTDLGFTAITNHGYCISIFGDTFDAATPDPPATGWRSPVGLRQHNADIQNGIVWDNCIGGARAKEMIPYRHSPAETPGQPITEIPNDLIHLPDGRYIMTTFGVRNWANSSAGGSWSTWYSRMWTSTETNAENWERTKDLDTGKENMDFRNDANTQWRYFQNNTMIMWPGEDWVYIYGTNEGRWNGGGIHLMRVDWRSMWKPSTYQFFGQDRGGKWGWRVNGPVMAILMPSVSGNGIGEISAQVIDGKVVLSYCDGVLGVVTRTSPRPEGVWADYRRHIDSDAAPFLYAPVIHPYSHLDGKAQMLLSQWPHAETPNGSRSTFYGVKQWQVDLSPSTVELPKKLAKSVGDLSRQPADLAGYTGPLAPPLSSLETPDLVAFLSDHSEDNTMDRADLTAAIEQSRAPKERLTI